MPPKGKKGGKLVEDDDLTLGRFGRTLKMGLVGLPNVGKSTTFNVLSNLDIPAENFPFCTKDPNEARVEVPDQRFNELCKIHNPKSKVPAHLSIWDIAGLIKGAHEGAGLGNAFLSNIQSVDGIFHVVRAFKDPSIIHVEGEINPINDLETISDELRFKDIAAINDKITELNKLINRSNDKLAAEEKEILDKALEVLEQKKWLKDEQWNIKEIYWLNKHLFMTAKPVVYLVNIGDVDYQVIHHTKSRNKRINGFQQLRTGLKNPAQER